MKVIASFPNKVGRLFLWCYIFLIISSYPFALAPPGSISLAYHIDFPSVFLLSLFSFPIIFSSFYRPCRLFSILMLLFCIPVVYHGIISTEHRRSTIEMLGHIIIPLGIALTFQNHNEAQIKNIYRFCFYYWLSQILHGFISFLLHEEITGFSGNRNWMASLLLALAPFAQRYLSYRSPSKSVSSLSKINIFPFLSGFFAIWIPTLFLVYHCKSRGAWLGISVALCLYIITYIFSNSPHFFRSFLQLRKIEKVFFFVLVTTSLMTLTLYTRFFDIYLSSPQTMERLDNAIRSDVRIPLWSATWLMIKDHDVLFRVFRQENSPRKDKSAFFGVGPGRFTESFAVYRSHSSYHKRLVSAPVTIHPHNEFLFLAAELGIMPAVAWLLMLLPLIPWSFANPLLTTARFSGMLLYVHSFFDMPLEQTPTNLLGFFCLGLCWKSHLIPVKRKEGGVSAHILKALASLSCGIFLLWGSAEVFSELRTDWHMRYGHITERKDPQKAFSAYQRAISSDPSRIKPYIYAASIAMNNNTPVALELLLKAYTINPNFAHLNALLSQCYSAKKDYSKALFYIMRECRLFPRDPKVHQHYFYNLFVTKNFSYLPFVSQELKGIYREKYSVLYGQTLGNHVREWMYAVQHERISESLRIAEEICQPIFKRFVDPLLYAQSEKLWLRPSLVSNYNYIDYIYWKQLFLLAKIKKQYLSGFSREKRDFILPELCSLFRKHITIDPSLQEDRLPDRVWQEKRANRLSYSYFLTALASQCGIPSFVLFDENHQPIHCVFLPGNDKQYVVTLGKSISTPTEKPVDFIKEKGKFLWMPQSLWLKNQILGTLVSSVEDQGNLPIFAEIPVLSMLDVWKKFDRNMVSAENIATAFHLIEQPMKDTLEKLSKKQ